MFLRPKDFLSVAIVVAFLQIPAAGQQNPKAVDPQRACNGAKNQMELNQCAGEQFHKADTHLNTLYGKVLEIMQKDLSEAQDRKDTDLIKHHHQAIEKLKAAERAWIQYRDLHCEAASHQYEGGSIRPMVWGFCMSQTTLDRIEELKSAYEEGDRKLE